MQATEDDLDGYDARKYFGLFGRCSSEELCRAVLDKTGTGLDFSALSSPQRSAVARWAVALGSLAPTARDWWWSRELAMSENAAADAAREAARLTVELSGPDAAAGLARRLLPSKPDASPTAVLAAMGRRVYDAVDRVVQDHNENAAGAERDAYSDLADRNPMTRFVRNPDPETYTVDDDDFY